MQDSIVTFWDFGSMHAALMDRHFGGDRYGKQLREAQPRAIDVSHLLKALDKIGPVFLHRLYANWLPFENYAAELNRDDLELLQVFDDKQGPPVSRRIVADINDHLRGANRASIVVVVGGGSEFVSIGKTVKQAGSRLVGIGLEPERGDDLWAQTCHEYLIYDQLEPAPRVLLKDTAVDQGGSVKDLLVQAMNQLGRHYGERWIQQVKIKPAIVRIDPDFDERDLGYESFSKFLREQQHLMERRHREGQQEPEFRLFDEFLESADPALQGERQQGRLVRHYLRVAGQQGIRMPDPVIMWEGIDVYAGFLKDNMTFKSFADIDVECLRLLKMDFPEVNMTEVKKVRQVLFKCFLFSSTDDGVIGFADNIETIEDIEEAYFDLMLARIGDNLREDLDYEALSVALTGTIKDAERLERLNEERKEDRD